MIYDDLQDTLDNELIMLYREDDEDAKNMLFYKYKFIMDVLIKKYSFWIKNFNIDYQEIYSECNVGFSDALRNYRDDKRASLPTFITLCVERKLSNMIRKYSREKHKVITETYSLDSVVNGTDVKLMDMISDEYKSDPLKNITDYEEYNELMRNIKSSLTTREYEVFVLMLRKLDYITIAKILNNTPKQIDNTMQRIKNKVKKILNSQQ